MSQTCSHLVDDPEILGDFIDTPWTDFHEENCDCLLTNRSRWHAIDIQELQQPLEVISGVEIWVSGSCFEDKNFCDHITMLCKSNKYHRSKGNWDDLLDYNEYERELRHIERLPIEQGIPELLLWSRFFQELSWTCTALWTMLHKIVSGVPATFPENNCLRLQGGPSHLPLDRPQESLYANSKG